MTLAVQFAKQFASVFFLGFMALTLALGLGALTGDLFDPSPFLADLRWFGMGLMLAGMALWIAARRYEAARPGLNPFLVFAAATDVLLVLFGLVVPGNELQPVSATLIGAGLGLLGLLVGVIVSIADPAYPRPLDRKWESANSEEDSGVKVHVKLEGGTEDDLSRIEGIGQKIAEILRAKGIDSFAALASRDIGTIRAAVDESGFKAPFDPTTWPQQAKLAASGDWEELSSLQDSLKGGRVSE